MFLARINHYFSTRYFILPVTLLCICLLDYSDVFIPAGRWLHSTVLHQVYNTVWKKKAELLGVYSTAPVLIAIDESSLNILGRWPWSRSVHAQLQTVLTDSPIPPSVVAWDIIFSEPEILGVINQKNDADKWLADAIDKAPYPTILAADFDLTSQPLKLIIPRKPLSDSRAILAHVHIEADNDGTIRQYFPSSQLFNSIALFSKNILSLPYLGTALFLPYTAPAINLDNTYPQKNKLNNELNNELNLDTNQAVTLYPMPNNWSKKVSYEAVLSGKISPDIWAKSPVLIAATAQGLGDQYVSYIDETSKVIAGGELVLAAFHTEKMMQAGFPRLYNASNILQMAWLCTVALFVFIGFRHIKQFYLQILLVITATLAVSCLVYYRLAVYGEWLNPWAMYCAIILIWLLWLTHKMQILLIHLFKHSQSMQMLQKINQNNHYPVEKDFNNSFDTETTILKNSQQKFLMKDAIDETIEAVNVLEDHTLFEFMRMNEVLHLMPDATFIFSTIQHNTIDYNGLTLRLNQQNQAAKRLTQQYSYMQQILALPTWIFNDLLLEFIADLTPEQTSVLSELTEFILPNYKSYDFMWNFLLIHEFNQNQAFIQGVEALSSKGLRYLIKLAPLLSKTDDILQPVFLNKPINTNCYILSIVDLSVSLALGKNRERTLSFLSHDLRSPQASILALIDLQKKQYPDSSPEYTELFKHIEFQAKRTIDLAEGFVQWSQASHASSYQFVEYNLNELMIEAVDELWVNAKQKNIILVAANDNIDNNIDDNIDDNTNNYKNNSINNNINDSINTDKELWVKIDRNLMWRSVVNLIMNALNVCQAGTTISLNTYKIGKYAVISVTDEGPGIPIELQDRLFEPFAQGTGLKRTGAGLGLAFVKTVCEQHHGRVHVISPLFLTPVNYGTCFELHIPLIDQKEYEFRVIDD